MKFSCAFVTFTYPGVEKFLPKFVNSLNNQCDIEFELVVHNDGIDKIDHFFECCLFPVHIICSGLENLFEIRLWSFKYCSRVGYKQIILGDSDDYFSTNRIRVNKEMLKKYNIIINDISLVNEFDAVYEERVFSRRIYNHSLIKIDDIKTYNFIGFTNSAFSIEVIKDFPDCVVETKVVDWLFYSVLLMQKKSAFFTTEAVSYYRQHVNNIAELRYSNQNLTIEKSIFLEQVKKNHLTALSKIKYLELKDEEVVLSKEKFEKFSKINFWWEI